MSRLNRKEMQERDKRRKKDDTKFELFVKNFNKAAKKQREKER